MPCARNFGLLPLHKARADGRWTRVLDSSNAFLLASQQPDPLASNAACRALRPCGRFDPLFVPHSNSRNLFMSFALILKASLRLLAESYLAV